MAESESGTGSEKIIVSGDGKKIFLLYPHSVIREEMLDTLLINGFETYTLFDDKRAVKIFERFPGSIAFINIDEGLPEYEWETYIKSLMKDPKTMDTMIGIMSYNQDKALMEKYLMDIAVHCGYIQLKLGLQQSKPIILNALHATEARGRRKFIRAFCHNDTSATMNFKSEKGIIKGQLLDISSAGIAVRCPGFPDLPANSLLRQVQFKLHGSILMADLVLMGKRKEDPNTLIMLFVPAAMKPEQKMIVYRFIKYTLQKYIDSMVI